MGLADLDLGGGKSLRDEVERNDEGGNLSVNAMKEFDAAMKGEVDSVVIA